MSRLRNRWVVIFMVAFFGVLSLYIAWRVAGSDGFWPAFWIEVGVAFVLFGLLYLVEQRLEKQVSGIKTEVDRDIGSLRTDVDSVRGSVEDLRQSLGEEVQQKLQEMDNTRSEPIRRAEEDPTFDNIKTMLMTARDNQWIHGSGVRVNLPRRHQLYIRFAPPQPNQLFINVRIEEPSQKDVEMWRWGQNQSTAEFFVDLVARLEKLHAGSFPRDDVDAAALTAALIRTVDVGFRSATGQPGIVRGVTDILEVPNDDFAITIRELRCLYNGFRADSRRLRERAVPLDELRQEYEWRDDALLAEAWRAAFDVLAPGGSG